MSEDEHFGPYERPSYLRAVNEPRWRLIAKIKSWVRWLDRRRTDSGPPPWKNF
jgi:hypothetical protein